MARAKSKLPVKPTLIIDTREKPDHRLIDEDDPDFSAVKIEKIDAGDYTIEEIPGLVVIEKKQSGHELWSNVVLYTERWKRELERLRHFRHKYIIIQQSYAEFKNARSWNGVPYKKRWQAMATVESWLISMTQTEGIHFIFVDKKNAGNHAKRILLKSYEWERKKIMRRDKELKELEENKTKALAKCARCYGAGWVWAHELDVTHETELQTQFDDNRYSCPDCRPLLLNTEQDEQEESNE